MPKAKYKKRADGRYLKQIHIGYYPSGKRRYKNIYGRTEKELEKNISAFLALKQKGIILSGDRITLSEMAGAWRDAAFPAGADDEETYNTYSMYEGAIRNYIDKSDLANVPVKDIRAEHLQALVGKIVAAGKDRTADIVKNTLKQIFDLAVDWHKIAANPSLAIRLKDYKPPAKRTTTQLEERAILDADLTARERMYVYLCLFGGLRRGEALALTYQGNLKTVDLTHKTITIDKAVVFKKNTGVIKPVPKSDASNRTMRAISPVVDAVTAFLLDATNQSDYLFETQEGHVTTLTSYRRMWESIIQKLNAAAGTEDNPAPINGLTAHILRHTFATYLAAHGAHPQTIQKLMGHGDAKMALDVYTHLPLVNRYAKSPIFKYYAEFLDSRKSVKTLKSNFRVIAKGSKKPLK